ncbi:hypothetical protein PUN28_000189 [Cardiocondyla obscurior]|uniref:Uncharacterized protein n=1 Tax=Cardiocondyla obscurior TaxID=286306 RepID=A0AAW2GY99_9HYME
MSAVLLPTDSRRLLRPRRVPFDPSSRSLPGSRSRNLAHSLRILIKTLLLLLLLLPSLSPLLSRCERVPHEKSCARWRSAASSNCTPEHIGC